MNIRSINLISAVFLVSSAVLTIFTTIREEPLVWRFQIDQANPAIGDEKARFTTIFNHRPASGEVHAPAVVTTPDGFALIWFQGTREAAPDIRIFRADFSKGASGWQRSVAYPVLAPKTISGVIDPVQLIIMMGNTVQTSVSEPSRYLATIVSFGGWAAAAIADVRAENGHVVTARKLNLSPLLNRSYLVKAPTLSYQDGDILVPAYHEMANAYGELVRLGNDGRVRDKRRITSGRLGIQPVIIPFDERNAVALLRNFNGTNRLVISRTFDGGQSWDTPTLSVLHNPNAPAAALRLSDGRLLIAHNDSATRADKLVLTLSNDRGVTWKNIASIEDHGGVSGFEARYPTLARLSNGEILLTYSANAKHAIRAHIFNEAWLDSL